DDNQCILSILPQKIGRNKAHPGEEIDHYGKFKNESAGDDRSSHEADVAGKVKLVKHVLAYLVLSEEINGKRSNYVVSKKHTQHEKYGRNNNEPAGIFLLIFLHCRGNKFPEFVKYIWKGNDKPGRYRNPYVGRKLS